MAGRPLLLVTGATGFVMSHVLRAWLEAHPEGAAVALDLAPPDPLAEAFLAPVAGRLTYLQGDLRDEALWHSLENDRATTHVVHGAAVTSINRLARRPDGSGDLTGALPALDANIMGTARLLAWAGRLERLERLVTVSSGSVYAAEGPSPLPEDGYVAPDDLYAITKYVGELLTQQVARQFGLPALSVRLSGVYGPLDRETATRAVASVPGTLLRKALAGDAVRLSGLAAIGDYIHAGDVGRAITRLLACPAPQHGVYNVAYGETVSLRDLADLVVKLVPGAQWQEAATGEADLVLTAHPPGGRWGAYDTARLRADTGWRARPLDEALADYRDWLERHPY